MQAKSMHHDSLECTLVFHPSRCRTVAIHGWVVRVHLLELEQRPVAVGEVAGV
jgi:hypothetical protein